MAESKKTLRRLDAFETARELDWLERPLLDMGAGVDAAYRAAVDAIPCTVGTRGEETGLFVAAEPQEEV